MNKFDDIINQNNDNTKFEEILVFNKDENSSSSKEDKSEISSLLSKSDCIISDSIIKQPSENSNSNHIKKI